MATHEVGATQQFTPKQSADLLLESALKNIFTYHPPKAGQPEIYEQIRSKGLEFATLLSKICPHSEEMFRAINKIDEAVMLANAAVARHG